ncbi:MAG: glycosyltransferase [Chloroflexi bacterium]|nr:glycosyltransferase [Chloroflexota bacterium]
MRVLIVQPWIRQGGAELLSLQLADALERAGDEAPIAALFVDPRGLPNRAVRRRYVLPPRWLADRFARSRLLTYAAGPLVLLGLVLRASATADVLGPQNLPAPLVAAIAGRLRRRPVVWTCNEVPEALPAAHAARLGWVEALAWKVGAASTRLVARSPHEILVLSEKTRRAVRIAYGRDALVVRPGVDLADLEAPHRGGPGRFTLLFVAKLHPQKDPLLAVRVLAAVRGSGVDATLTIVGEGPERPALDALVRELGLAPYVRLEAGLELRELVEAYRTSDALLVTAGGHQSWGLTPFEALASGTPSVLSPEAGAAELLGPAEAALVVPREARRLAAAAVRLATEPDLGPRLVENGKTLLHELTWERYSRQCRAAYERALAAS